MRPTLRHIDRQRATSRSGPTVVVLRVAVAALVAGALVGPALAVRSGWREAGLVNGDEAVAALLPTEFSRDGIDLLFPGNVYQGVVEVPAYWLIQVVAGPHLLPLRLLHQTIWLGALAVWCAAALEPARRRGRIGPRGTWWAAFAVMGLAGVTSVVGWPVWSHVYPGYHLGALLGGLGVWVAVRAVASPVPGPEGRARWWLLAGVLTGAAVYAQPMHVGAVVVVLSCAVVPGRGVLRRAVPIVAGAVVGAAPLLWWNVRHDLATFDPDRQPVAEHPEWGYPQRVLGVARTTWRVLWGGDQVTLPPWANVFVALVVAGLVVLCVWGVVALARWRGAALALLIGPAVMLVGLPVLRVMSLQVDQRYAVGWWPALVVLLAAGAASIGEVHGGVGRALRAALVVVVGAHLAVVAAGVADQADAEGHPDPDVATADLVDDLRRCGVDVVRGDYWGVYPLVWAADGRLRGQVDWGPDRLQGTEPARDDPPARVAVMVPGAFTDVGAAAVVATEGSGRGAQGWLAVHDPDTGARLALEVTATPLPTGCLRPEGLVEGEGS